jgi:hypothetical protein
MPFKLSYSVAKDQGYNSAIAKKMSLFPAYTVEYRCDDEKKNS